MKIRLGDLKRLIAEAHMHESLGTTNFTFNAYGPDDETYVVHAAYNPRTPFEVEIWKATTEAGVEVDVDELRAMGQDLEAMAFDEIARQSGDGIGLDYDDIHGKSGIDY